MAKMASGNERGPNPAAPKHEGGLALEERTRTRKPPLYKVLLHNDDYTTKEFVVMILQVIFQLSETDATQVMMHVHTTGVGVAGVYTFEMAETKVAKVLQVAKRFEFPLQCTLEPE